MIKYTNTEIVFSEVPDEITLAINISNCPNLCEGCHSPYLRQDIGNPLHWDSLKNILDKSDGVTCIAFMGGDATVQELSDLCYTVKVMRPDLKIAWYSGLPKIHKDMNLRNLNFIKVGPYIPEFGPLNSRSTNQRMYKCEPQQNGSDIEINLIDITFKFWKDGNK